MISSFTPQKNKQCVKNVGFSLNISIKVGVKKEKNKKKEEKTGSPFTTKISHDTCVCNTKIPWLILLSWHHRLTDMIGIMWCASCSGDCCHHTKLVRVVLWSTRMLRSAVYWKGQKLKDLHTNNNICLNLDLWEGRSLERGIFTYPSFAHTK